MCGAFGGDSGGESQIAGVDRVSQAKRRLASEQSNVAYFQRQLAQTQRNIAASLAAVASEEAIIADANVASVN